MAMRIYVICFLFAGLFISPHSPLLAKRTDSLIISGTLETGPNLVFQSRSQVPNYKNGFMFRGGGGIALQRPSFYTFGVSLFYTAAMNQVDFPQFGTGNNLQTVQTLHFIESVAYVERQLAINSPWVVGLRLGLPILASGNVRFKTLPEQEKRKSSKLNVQPYWTLNPSIALQFGYNFKNTSKMHYVYAFASSCVLPVYKKDNPMRWVFLGLGYRFSLVV